MIEASTMEEYGKEIQGRFSENLFITNERR
jgi:hypothetical protein